MSIRGTDPFLTPFCDPFYATGFTHRSIHEGCAKTAKMLSHEPHGPHSQRRLNFGEISMDKPDSFRTLLSCVF